MPQDIHLLFDLTRSDLNPALVRDCLGAVMSPDELGSYFGNATVLLPRDFPLEGATPPKGFTLLPTANPLQEANAILEHAGNCDAHLLALLSPLAVNSEAIGMLVNAFGLDAHFGVSVPRQQDRGSGDVVKLSPDLGDPALAALPRRVLTEIPDYYLLPEFLSACQLVRNTLVSNLPVLDTNYDTLAGAFQQYLCRIRRAGFRTVVLNRAAVFAFSGEESVAPAVSKSDNRKLHMQYPDFGKAKTEIIEHSLHMHESLLGRAFNTRADTRKSLLLDIRGVQPYVNGTAEAALGFCDGLLRLGSGWTVTLLAEPASADYHRLAERYPAWKILTALEKGFYTAAFRPSQPWHVTTMIELHEMALLNFYGVLDTISWDILFEAPRGLDAYWSFMSEYADGLLYDSADTRKHFIQRFPCAKSIPDHLFHLSFHPDDYANSAIRNGHGGDEGILIIGNSYDHKHLAPTVDLLSSAFPFQSLKVLGLKSHASARVQVLESGRVPQSEIDELFARAKLIVFPSLYEGFGLPVLKGLSYDRTVIARESDLLREIAGLYKGPGRLLSFSTPQALVDTVGKAVHHAPLEDIPLGTTLPAGQEPQTWKEVASGVIGFIEQRLAKPAEFRWTQRERSIRLLNACSA